MPRSGSSAIPDLKILSAAAARPISSPSPWWAGPARTLSTTWAARASASPPAPPATRASPATWWRRLKLPKKAAGGVIRLSFGPETDTGGHRCLCGRPAAPPRHPDAHAVSRQFYFCEISSQRMSSFMFHLSPPGARLLQAAVPAGSAADPAESHHHFPGICGHLHGGYAGAAMSCPPSLPPTRPSTCIQIIILGLHQRTHRPGQPVLGQGGHRQPSTAAWASACTPGCIIAVSVAAVLVLLPPPCDGSGDQQRPAH